MSKTEKALLRLRSCPADYTWDELTIVLRSFGYRIKTGAGSSRVFINDRTEHKIFLHEPHPQPILKRYALRQVLQALKEKKLIDDEE